MFRKPLAVIVVASLLVPFLHDAARAAETVVNNAADARNAIANAHAGDTIVLADGSYDLGNVKVSVRATEAEPVVIKAQNAGKATLTDSSEIRIERASYVMISGFVLSPTDLTPLTVAGSNDVRVTRNVFRVRETEPDNEKKGIRWLSIDGVGSGDDAHNCERVRIDHNLFDEKHAPSNFIAVNGLGTQVAQHVRIDHNHFRKIGPRITNGKEAIRVGLSGLSLSDGFNVVESNLFEECDGDPEIISIKCCKTQVIDNTFVRCQGGVCLRHGNDNVVSGNVFLGEHKKGTDGVRAYGDDHRIENNFMQDLTGAAINITNGGIDYGSGEVENRKLLTGHFRPQRIKIESNAIVGCGQPISLGTKMKDNKGPPRDLTFAKNVIIGTPAENTPVKVTTMPEGMKLEGNVVELPQGAKLGLDDVTAEQFKVVSPGEAKAPAEHPKPLTPADVGPDAPGE